MLSIIESCAKANTVKRLVFTSSAGTLDVQEDQKLFYDETSWSDLDFIYAKKMTGWVRLTILFFFICSLKEKQYFHHIAL